MIGQRAQPTTTQTIHSAEIYANTAQVNLPLVFMYTTHNIGICCASVTFLQHLRKSQIIHTELRFTQMLQSYQKSDTDIFTKLSLNLTFEIKHFMLVSPTFSSRFVVYCLLWKAKFVV